MMLLKLSLNIDKTNVIMFRSPQHSFSEIVCINFGKFPIKQTSYVKFLGVLLDENLSWKYRLTELSKKTGQNLWYIFQS